MATLKLTSCTILDPEEYKSKNTEPEKLTKSFDLRLNYVLISKDDFKTAFQGKELAERWQGFYKKYPDSAGRITFQKLALMPESNMR